MKTVFTSHAEVCHIWAQQTQEKGRANNVSFENETIYSYEWWPMAKFINEDTVLIRDWSYSNSTVKHIGHVRNAIRHLNVIEVYNPEDIYDSIQKLIDEVKNTYNSFESKRNKHQIYLENEDAFNRLAKLCEATGRNIPDINHYVIQSELLYMAQVEEYLRGVEEKREQQRIKEELFKKGLEEERNSKGVRQLQNDWYNGGVVRYFEYKKQHFPIFDYPALRIKDNQVETFYNAHVPINEAKILYKMIQAKKDIKGYRIGSYTVISINGTLKIGCHNIPVQEVNRFGKELLNA